MLSVQDRFRSIHKLASFARLAGQLNDERAAALHPWCDTLRALPAPPPRSGPRRRLTDPRVERGRTRGARRLLFRSA